eukprot:scaffold1313_cov250-Pinguiococcus_pyrenoidosus.AAC.8
MVTGDTPWKELRDPFPAMYRIAHTKTPPPVPEDMDAMLKAFIRVACQVNPRKRPSALELLSHPFLVRYCGPLDKSEIIVPPPDLCATPNLRSGPIDKQESSPVKRPSRLPRNDKVKGATTPTSLTEEQPPLAPVLRSVSDPTEVRPGFAHGRRPPKPRNPVRRRTQGRRAQVESDYSSREEEENEFKANDQDGSRGASLTIVATSRSFSATTDSESCETPGCDSVEPAKDGRRTGTRRGKSEGERQPSRSKDASRPPGRRRQGEKSRKTRRSRKGDGLLARPRSGSEHPGSRSEARTSTAGSVGSGASSCSSGTPGRRRRRPMRANLTLDLEDYTQSDGSMEAPSSREYDSSFSRTTTSLSSPRRRPGAAVTGEYMGISVDPPGGGGLRCNSTVASVRQQAALQLQEDTAKRKLKPTSAAAVLQKAETCSPSRLASMRLVLGPEGIADGHKSSRELPPLKSAPAAHGSMGGMHLVPQRGFGLAGRRHALDRNGLQRIAGRTVASAPTFLSRLNQLPSLGTPSPLAASHDAPWCKGESFKP